MKNNIGITVAAVGLLCTICAPTIFENNIYIQYGASGLGVLLSIFGAFKADREGKFNRNQIK